MEVFNFIKSTVKDIEVIIIFVVHALYNNSDRVSGTQIFEFLDKLNDLNRRKLCCLNMQYCPRILLKGLMSWGMGEVCTGF